MRPSSQALRRISSGHVPSLSYSQATGRISFSAKSCAISRRASCSSVRVKSTTVSALQIDWSVNSSGKGTYPEPAEQQRTVVPGRMDGPPQCRLMEEAFAIVLFVVVGVAVVAAIWALVTSGGSYDDIGGGGMALDRREATPAERETEIRQMLQARNSLREARGEAPLDVDAEYRALTTSEDPGAARGGPHAGRGDQRAPCGARRGAARRRGRDRPAPARARVTPAVRAHAVAKAFGRGPACCGWTSSSWPGPRWCRSRAPTAPARARCCGCWRG